MSRILTLSIAMAVAVAMMTVGVAGPARAETLTLPVDIGIAPAVHLITGPIQDDQLTHYGLKLSLQAVIDQATIQRYKHKVPARYRKYVEGATEIRLSPFWYLPDTLILSPKIDNTQMWGVVFRPIGIGISPVSRPVRINLSAGALLSYIYLQSDTVLEDPMHFLRIGVDLKLDIEFPISRSFLMSVGWASQLYIPQKLNAGVFEVGGLDDSIWHIGQAYLMFHFRVPYSMNL
jgi:hypothetical protein